MFPECEIIAPTDIRPHGRTDISPYESMRAIALLRILFSGSSL